jgi:hypothetical protein
MDLNTLKDVLQMSWCAATAYGEWDSHTPSSNQCAVTALVVQDYFGGKILRRKLTNGNNHFLNKLPDGTEIDLTETQFSLIITKPIKETTIGYSRNKILRHASVTRRYELLKQRVEDNLAKNTYTR